MAISQTGAVLNTLTPRPTQGLFGDNYLSLSDMDFTKQFLPDVYEKEVERFGNRTVSGFLRMVGAEMPMSSDQVVWSEQGRLHVAFDDCAVANSSATTTVTLASEANKDLLAVGMTVILAKGFKVVKARISAVSAAGSATITVAPYGAPNLNGLNTGSAANLTGVKLFVYGSEFKKGSADGGKSIDAKFTQFSNKPIILRDKYTVNGSDTAQIGWVEVTSENGASGYLWYLKSEHEARLRFEDQLEMAMVEAVKDDGTNGAGSAGHSTSSVSGFQGSEGLFAAVESRGMIYNDANFDGTSTGQGLSEFDDILAELDKQGAIEENMMFLDRATALSIDNMLAAQNSYGAGGTSYGVFNNSEDMALNLGFSGFRRGSYDFYKTDWKYLNDSTTRGLIDDIDGIIVPAGTSTVYDQNLGKNIARPFLHIRYRASEADDRKMKSWITGSVGGNYTSAADEMNVHFLSERALCVQAANNFVLLKSTT